MRVRLQVFKTEKRGWGIRTLNDIPAGGFICIYVGNLYSNDEANRQGQDFGDEYFAELDMIEIHMAHGYLLSYIISPVSNIRRDEYGGELLSRLKFPIEILKAVRSVWPKGKPIACRISATDWLDEGGLNSDDAVIVAKQLFKHGADIIDVSAGQTTPDARPIYGRMFQTHLSEQVLSLIHI